jgi:RNAse (barnase) inhibitor barstar
MNIIIDCSQINNKMDFYNQLTKQISFGDFFGNNLDAFRDYISILFGNSIKFKDFSYLNKEMKSYIERVMSIIMDS